MARSEKVSLELVQSMHDRFDPDENARAVIDAAGASDADMLVFPELFLTGYCLGRSVNSYAMAIDDTHIAEIAEAASDRGKAIVAGFPERSDEVRGQVHNSAAVFLPDRGVSTYRKMHLVDFDPFEEWAYYTPGKAPHVFEFKGVRFGVTICYDIFFPELVKYYALSGVDAVICISASPSTTRPFFEAIVPARAIENTVFMVYDNMVGMDGRIGFGGGGTNVGPRGEVLAKGPYFEEARVRATIDPEAIEQSRRHRPTIRDTTPEIYEMIIDRIKGKPTR
jgi:predicted amidohydrolase